MDHSEVKHLPKVDHTPAELDEASRLLLKAADVLERQGLAKETRCNELGSHCVLGAIDVAAGYDPNWGIDEGKSSLWWSAVNRLAKSIEGEYDQRPNWRAAGWNNASERTQPQVIAKLRAVALGG